MDLMRRAVGHVHEVEAKGCLYAERGEKQGDNRRPKQRDEILQDHKMPREYSFIKAGILAGRRSFSTRLPINAGGEETQGAPRMQEEKIRAPAAGSLRVVPHPDLRVHEKPHPPQAGARAKIHVLEIEMILFVHAPQGLIYARGHQPEHGGDPVRVDQSMRVRGWQFKVVSRNSAPDKFQGGRKRAKRILDGSVCIHHGGSDEVRPVRMQAGCQFLEYGLFEDQVGVEDRKILSLRNLESPVVVAGKALLSFVPQDSHGRPGRGIEFRQVVSQVIGQDDLKLRGITFVPLQAGKQAVNLFGITVADDGEGDERLGCHCVLFR